MNDQDDLLMLLSEQPGITEEWRSVSEILEAMGRPVTAHTRSSLRDKIRPFIKSGIIECKRGYVSRMGDSGRVMVPKYRKAPTPSTT